MPMPRQINNPLTLIGVFAGISEVAGTVVLTQLNGLVQLIFVWFVMLFPVLLVVLFFGTLNRNPKVIYGPSDYRDESHFVSIMQGSYTPPSEHGNILREFWKPGGAIDQRNQKRLREWMMSKGIASRSITLFLKGNLFRDARAQAVDELGLGGYNQD